MVIITPKMGFSNYLQVKHPDMDVKHIHTDVIEGADKIILNDVVLNDFLLSFSIDIDDISIIAQESDEDFYYIRYSEDSLIDIVFDIDVTEIIEIVMSPKALKRKAKTKIKDSYTEIINKFLQDISPLWDIKSYLEDSSNDIYFIDVKRGQFLHLKHNIELLLQALKDIDAQIEGVAYIKESNDFKIISQNIPQTEIAIPKIGSTESFSKTKKDRKLVIELKNTEHLSFEQKNAVSILCNIALSFFDGRDVV